MRARHNIVWSVGLAAMVVALWPTDANAQRRYRRVRSQVVIVGGYYDPFWLYDPWYGNGYGHVYPYPPFPYRHFYDPGASLRLEVKPNDAEVYIDGYYAGVVDDFDGVFQRLPIEPGEHDITLYLDGYRTVRQRVYLTPRRTFKVKHVMERLAAGEQPEPRPAPAQPPTQAGAPQGPPQAPPQGPPPGRGPAARRPPPPRPDPQTAPAPISGYGSIAIRVQPADAEISIDGETWRGPDAQQPLLVEVAEGRHTIEVSKAGYRTYVTDVEVRRGETATLNVSLRTQ